MDVTILELSLSAGRSRFLSLSVIRSIFGKLTYFRVHDYRPIVKRKVETQTWNHVDEPYNDEENPDWHCH